MGRNSTGNSSWGSRWHCGWSGRTTWPAGGDLGRSCGARWLTRWHCRRCPRCRGKMGWDSRRDHRRRWKDRGSITYWSKGSIGRRGRGQRTRYHSVCRDTSGNHTGTDREGWPFCIGSCRISNRVDKYFGEDGSYAIKGLSHELCPVQLVTTPVVGPVLTGRRVDTSQATGGRARYINGSMMDIHGILIHRRFIGQPIGGRIGHSLPIDTTYCNVGFHPVGMG